MTKRKDKTKLPPKKPKANAPETDEAAVKIDPVEVEEIELSEAAERLLRDLEAERDEAVAARQRALADFVNFQRRARENEARATRDGATTVVRMLIPALDHFDMAINQDQEKITVSQLMDGVRMVRRELARALEGQGVTVIEPVVGDDFDPNRHQAMMRQPTDEHRSGTIVSVFQVGYAIDDLVLRPASVVVAAAPEDEETAEGEE